MTDILATAKNHQLKILRDAIDKLEKFEQVSTLSMFSFTMTKILTDDSLNELAKQLFTSGRFIYFFKTNRPQEISSLFKKYSEIKGNNRLARHNGNDNSTILYVGSSNSLQKRFKEHCGLASKSTYAIKFRDWLTDDNLEIEFHYFQLDNTDQDILQHIEDGLWKSMKPVLGKFGGKY